MECYLNENVTSTIPTVEHIHAFVDVHEVVKINGRILESERNYHMPDYKNYDLLVEIYFIIELRHAFYIPSWNKCKLETWLEKKMVIKDKEFIEYMKNADDGISEYFKNLIEVNGLTNMKSEPMATNLGKMLEEPVAKFKVTSAVFWSITLTLVALMISLRVFLVKYW